MANNVLQYDPKNFTMICGPNVISGFADDSFVEVERYDDAFTMKTGVDGVTTRAKNSMYAGKITIRLMQSSASNDALSNFALLDQQDPPTGSFAILAKDTLGRSVFSAQTAWVKKFPKSEWKKDVNTVEWVLDCGSPLQIFIGGE
jgi:hypothetical protein